MKGCSARQISGVNFARGKIHALLALTASIPLPSELPSRLFWQRFFVLVPRVGLWKRHCAPGSCVSREGAGEACAPRTAVRRAVGLCWQVRAESPAFGTRAEDLPPDAMPGLQTSGNL